MFLLRCVQLEEERDRLEGDKLELAGAGHQLEAEYKVQLTRRGWSTSSSGSMTRTCSTRHGGYGTKHSERRTRENLLHEKVNEMFVRIRI